MDMMKATATTTLFHHPTKVEAKTYGLDKWLNFESSVSYTDKDGVFNHALLKLMVLVNDPHALFQLRHAVDQLIQAYMEE